MSKSAILLVLLVFIGHHWTKQTLLLGSLLALQSVYQADKNHKLPNISFILDSYLHKTNNTNICIRNQTKKLCKALLNQNADETPSRIRKWFACTPWQGNRAGALQGGAPTQALLCSTTHQQHNTGAPGLTNNHGYTSTDNKMKKTMTSRR